MSEMTQMKPTAPPPKERSSTGASRRPLLLFALLVLVGLLLTALFALRASRSYRHFQEERRRPPRENIEGIAPWMSVPYVAAAYGVPSDFLFEQLEIPAAGNDRKPLGVLERTYFDGERGVILERARVAVELYYVGGVVPTPILPDPDDVPMPEIPDHGDRPRDGPPPGEGGPP
jgi:hypothetical protein